MEARVGYLGPPGTFSEEALLASARTDGIQPIPLGTIYETVMALQRGDIEWAIVPIENSLDGSVSVTLDLLAEEAGALEVVGEALLAVRHSLIASEMIELAEIETVITHPQVPGQCKRLLRGELAHASVLTASSTAEAVRIAAAGDQAGLAALGTLLAARIYGGTVVREGVQDRADNETRFLWIGRRERGAGEDPPLSEVEGPRRTSLVFWGAGAERPGWLVGCLDEFARRKINLSRIESRPRRERMGHYMFFVDLQGGLEEEAVAEAVARLERICEEVLVLGSYPRALARALNSSAIADG